MDVIYHTRAGDADVATATALQLQESGAFLYRSVKLFLYDDGHAFQAETGSSIVSQDFAVQTYEAFNDWGSS